MLSYMLFHFILYALFVLKIFKFLISVLNFWGMQKKRLDQKNKVNFKIDDVTNWLTNNYNAQDIYCPISHKVKATRQ